MATHVNDLKNAVVIGQSLSPVARLTGGSPFNGSGIDLRLGGGANQSFAIISASFTDGVHTVKMQASENNATADEQAAIDAYADITGASVVVSAAGVTVLRFASPKRWVRAVSTVSGTTTGAIYGVVIGAQKRN